MSDKAFNLLNFNHGERVKFLLKERGISHTDMALKMGFKDRSGLHPYLKREDWSTDMIRQVCTVLDISEQEYFGVDNYSTDAGTTLINEPSLKYTKKPICIEDRIEHLYTLYGLLKKDVDNLSSKGE